METLIKKELIEVHFQHGLWLRQLKFYKEELHIFQERLEEIASKNTSKEVHVSIEQFQNRFVIQHQEIDKIKHLININEDKTRSAAIIPIRRLDYVSSKEFMETQEMLTQFEKLFAELKKDFFTFLAKWM